MTTKTVFLMLYGVLCISMVIICVVSYCVLKRIKSRTASSEHDESLRNTPINDKKQSDKLSFAEWGIYGSLFLSSGLYVFCMMPSGPSFPILGRMVILPPILALFNARKRTGKSIFALVVSLAVFFVAIFTHLIIGFPTRAPSVTLSGTPINMGQSTVQELYDNGLDLYLRGEDIFGGTEIPPEHVTEQYTRYDGKSDITIPAGERYANTSVNRADYILVKNGVAIGNVNLYGNANKPTLLNDCIVVSFETSKAYLIQMEQEGYSLFVDDIALREVSEREVEEAYKDDIYHKPDFARENGDGNYYGVNISSASGGIFWPEYYMTLYLNSNDPMVQSFKITCTSVGER